MDEEQDPHLKIISLAKCLHGFGLRDLNELLRVASKSAWRKDVNIFLEGDPGRDMFIICAGRVVIWRDNGGQRLELASLSPGESFGEMALVEGGKRSAGAQATEETLALRISHDRLYEAPTAASLLYRNIAKALAERLNVANDIILFQSKHGATVSPLEATGKHRALK